MQNAAKEEILVLIRSLRSHIEADRELPGNVSSFCLRGPVPELKATGGPVKDAAGQAPMLAPGPNRHFAVPDISTSLTGAGGSAALEDVRTDLGDCRRCSLHEGRKNIVFGEGNPRAELVFVGEAPGADEDAQGRPFVGRAGQLLTKIIEAMKLQRQDVYICNILKCRPPGNRNPEPEEIAACRGYLEAQIDAVRPEVLVLLGRVAAHALLESDAPVGRLRGSWHEVRGIATRVTYHPAALLRDAGLKRPAWEDLKVVRDRLTSGGAGD